MLGLPYIGSPESVHVTKVSGLIWFTVMCL